MFKEHPGVTFGSTRLVTMRALDSWARSNGVDRVDFMWLDMQGYELDAIRGAERLLGNVAAVHMEICNVQLYDGSPLYPEVKRRMAQYGFAPAIEAFFRVSGNVLFVPRRADTAAR
jgi:hypothetical protein